MENEKKLQMDGLPLYGLALKYIDHSIVKSVSLSYKSHMYVQKVVLCLNNMFWSVNLDLRGSTPSILGLRSQYVTTALANDR